MNSTSAKQQTGRGDWSYKRQWRRLRKKWLHVLSLGDPRRSLDQHEEVWVSLITAGRYPEHLPMGFARTVCGIAKKPGMENWGTTAHGQHFSIMQTRLPPDSVVTSRTDTPKTGTVQMITDGWAWRPSQHARLSQKVVRFIKGISIV